MVLRKFPHLYTGQNNLRLRLNGGTRDGLTEDLELLLWSVFALPRGVESVPRISLYDARDDLRTRFRPTGGR